MFKGFKLPSLNDSTREAKRLQRAEERADRERRTRMLAPQLSSEIDEVQRKIDMLVYKSDQASTEHETIKNLILETSTQGEDLEVMVRKLRSSHVECRRLNGLIEDRQDEHMLLQGRRDNFVRLMDGH